MGHGEKGASMIVAIDGPSGSGKSSVAREVARRCDLTYLDTGAMYRSVALACLRRGVDPEDSDAVATVAREVRIEFINSHCNRMIVEYDYKQLKNRYNFLYAIGFVSKRNHFRIAFGHQLNTRSGFTIFHSLYTKFSY